VGNQVQRRVQKNRVRKSLEQDEGGLGAVLNEWNEGYFGKLGLVAELWMSEDGLKKESENAEKGDWKTGFERRRRQIQRFSSVVVNKEAREQWKGERKYMVVLQPTPAVPGTVELEGEFEAERPELDGVKVEVAEMSAEGVERVELPSEKMDPVELDSTPFELDSKSILVAKEAQIRELESRYNRPRENVVGKMPWD
jgi:hypothetical protein